MFSKETTLASCGSSTLRELEFGDGGVYEGRKTGERQEPATNSYFQIIYFVAYVFIIMRNK